MPNLPARFAAHLKGNASSLRRLVLYGAFAYMLYLGAWYLWRGHVSNTPGFLFIFCSFPWSLPWLALEPQLHGWVAWPFRNAITALAIALGFGFNCAVVGAIVSFLRQPWHNIPVNRDAVVPTVWWTP